VIIITLKNSSHLECGHQGQFLFLIGYCLKKSSRLKLLCKMEPNLAGSIYVRSSIKLLHLVPFGLQTWPPILILSSLAPFGQAVSEEKIFLTLANQKKELILAAMFVGRMEPNEDAL
jgi:hypothetical protein